MWKKCRTTLRPLKHGLHRLREDDFPLSLRLLRDMHALLLQGGRGARKDPGQFRKGQVFVGGGIGALAHFVPPPPDALPGALAEFEQFLHLPHDEMPALVKAALAHVQFETIHPFNDGNGRLGRLLIALILCHEGVLRDPTLSLSLYFKRHRAAYYDRLNAVRTEGDWGGWLGFFLDGVAETTQQAVETAQRLPALLAADRARIATMGSRAGNIGLMRVRTHGDWAGWLHYFLDGVQWSARRAIRQAGQLLALRERLHARISSVPRALPLLDALFANPHLDVQRVKRLLDVSDATARRLLQQLEDLGILRETTGLQRGRRYLADAVLAAIDDPGEKPL